MRSFRLHALRPVEHMILIPRVKCVHDASISHEFRCSAHVDACGTRVYRMLGDV